MQLTTNQHNNVLSVELPETITMGNANELRDELSALVDQEQNRMLLNMSNVKFVDSSGLSTLVSVYKRLKALGGNVAMYNPSKNVVALLELTRLHEIFAIYADAENAIEDLQNMASVA